MDSREKSTILLIDDDKSLLITLRDFLQFEGYNVVTAASGEEGLEQLKTLTPDLIVLDMSMPGMGGIGFLDEISTDGNPNHPVLVLTARGQMAEFFGDKNVEGFVAKPCDPNDLLMEIGRVIFLTKGAILSKEESEVVHRKTVLIGEEDEIVSGTLAEIIGGEGYIVSSVSRGPDILEKAILEHPDVIVVNTALLRSEDRAVERMLKEMPNTRNVPIVRYDAGDVLAEGNESGTGERRIADNSTHAILSAISELLNV